MRLRGVNVYGSSPAHHPNPAAVSRIITTRPNVRLEFNYRTKFTTRWESRRLQRRFRYQVVFPSDGEQWLTVRL